MVKKYISFTDEQNFYINYLLKERRVNEGTNYLWENIDWISLVQNHENCPKNIYKEFLEQEVTLAEYTKWLSTQPKIDLGLGVPVAASSAENEGNLEEKKAESKEEVKVN